MTCQGGWVGQGSHIALQKCWPGCYWSTTLPRRAPDCDLPGHVPAEGQGEAGGPLALYTAGKVHIRAWKEKRGEFLIVGLAVGSQNAYPAEVLARLLLAADQPGVAQNPLGIRIRDQINAKLTQ